MVSRSHASNVPPEVVHRFRMELKRTMESRNLLQQDVARMVGVHQKTISTWLHGRQFPMPDSAHRLADALDNPKLGEYGIYRVECAWKGCTNLAEFNPRGGHPGSDVWCSVECYRKWRWYEVDKPKRTELSVRVSKAMANKAMAENRDLKARIRQNCEDCAGLGQPCPLIDDCVFIPVTHLLTRKQRAELAGV